MSDLTLKELIIFVVVVAVIASVVVAIVKSSLKIALVGLLCLIMFSGFTWLPEKIGEALGDQNAIDPDMTLGVDETLQGIGNTAKDIIDENKDSWIEAAKSLWQKIMGEDSSNSVNNIASNNIEGN